MDAKEPKNARAHSERFMQGQEASTNESTSTFAGLESWETFHRSQTRRLSRIAIELGVPRDRIPDVLQKVWLDALKHHEGFQGENADQRLASWLSAVVRSKARDLLRRIKRQQAVSLESLLAVLVDGATGDPAEVVEAEERDVCLQAMFEELRKQEPLNCWLVWERIVEGRSIRDLASERGLGIHAVHCRINRVLKRLRGQLCANREFITVSRQSSPTARTRKKEIF